MIAVESSVPLEIGKIVSVSKIQGFKFPITNAVVVKVITEEEYIDFQRENDPNFYNESSYNFHRADKFYYLVSED